MEANLFFIFHILTALPVLLVGSVMYEIFRASALRGEVKRKDIYIIVGFVLVFFIVSQVIAYDLNSSRGIIYGWQSLIGTGK